MSSTTTVIMDFSSATLKQSPIWSSWPRSHSSTNSATWSGASSTRRPSHTRNYTSCDYLRHEETPSSYICDEDLLAEATSTQSSSSGTSTPQIVEEQESGADVVAPSYNTGVDAYKARKAQQELRRREVERAAEKRRTQKQAKE